VAALTQVDIISGVGFMLLCHLAAEI
jgi:hypothetical protein